MWRSVDPGLTDVSEERITSIFRIEKSASRKPASAGGSETSVNQESTQRHIQKDDILPMKYSCLSTKVHCVFGLSESIEILILLLEPHVSDA
jgi:hypothetical protein